LKVTMKEYVDMRFENVNTRFEAIDTAQRAALASVQLQTAAALAAQKELTLASFNSQQSKSTGRTEIWAYIVGVGGMIIAAITAVFTKLH
jgi:hypothetical protein